MKGLGLGLDALKINSDYVHERDRVRVMQHVWGVCVGVGLSAKSGLTVVVVVVSRF